MPALAHAQNPNYPSNGGRMVTVDGRTLPLEGARLTADARAGVVRVTLEQTFANPYEEPLEVTYTLPLPADGAVSGFSFRIGETRVVGEVDLKHRARERYQEALVSGRTAALLEQERSSVFTQSVGNIPAKQKVVAEIVVDQKLAFLPEGAWEWRFPTVVAPRYMGQPGRVADVERVAVEVADAPMSPRVGFTLAIRDALADGARVESPSHPVHSSEQLGRTEVTLQDGGGARLDRDVVVRWNVAKPEVGVAVDCARPEAKRPSSDSQYALVTLVPPDREAKPASVARDLIVLLDTSGSMGGEPLDQAKKVTAALVDSLGEEDRLELIEFSNEPRRWKKKAVNAGAKEKKDAQAWLAKLHASGGTEMRTGILEALAAIRPESQRQVVLITDGLIGFEQEVLKEILHKLPPGSRVHTVGIGSGVNRSLTMPAARAGRGCEVIIALGEDPERAAKRLLARTVAPLVVDVTLSGSALVEAAPLRLPDLFAGAPALLSAKLKAEGGELTVSGRTPDGEWTRTVSIEALAPGQGNRAVAALFAREKVEDLEMTLAAQGSARELDKQIEQLGVSFQISTRLTSWVAITEEATVDPTQPTRKANVPQELPHGMSAEGLGLRAANAPAPLAAAPVMQASVRRSEMPVGGRALGRASGGPGAPPPPAKKKASVLDFFSRADEAPAPEEEAAAELSEGYADDDEVTGAGAPMAPPPSVSAPSDKAAPRPASASRPTPKGAAEEKAKDLKREARVPKTLDGRVLVEKDGTLTLEVTAEDGLAWDPEDEVVVRLEDGSLVTVKVERTSTTKPMTASGGQRLRLTVKFDGGAPASKPAELMLRMAGEVVRVAVKR